jgi:hypothetical protein
LESAAPDAGGAWEAPEDGGRVHNPAAALASLAFLFAWSGEPEGLREPRRRGG